jgi:hypothetical protein
MKQLLKVYIIQYIIENSSKRGGEWINISTRILNEINVKCK